MRKSVEYGMNNVIIKLQNFWSCTPRVAHQEIKTSSIIIFKYMTFYLWMCKGNFSHTRPWQSHSLLNFLFYLLILSRVSASSDPTYF